MPSRRTSVRPAAGLPDEAWRALLAYDPALNAAAERLAPFGAPALAELRRAGEAVPDKAALPEMVSAIEARWAAQASADLTHVETRDGVAVLQDTAGRYHVGGRETADLATARLLASASARGGRLSSLAGALILGAAVLASAATGTAPAQAQTGAVAATTGPSAMSS